MNFEKDPIGYAIWDFSTNNSTENIIVESDLCDDDILPPPYLFRTFEEMPELEQLALKNAQGKILDIGGAAGCHAQYLSSIEKDVLSIDISQGAVDFMISEGINAEKIDVLDLNDKKFDTILILMNGLGIAGTLAKMKFFLEHLKSILSENGKIYCDSADIKYMYEDEDGGLWMDLNAEYYGEMKFNMKYKTIESGWFDWIYIDQEKLQDVCKTVGLKCDIIFEGEQQNYLAQLTHL
ncbi:MAG: class I SAM-dependent methyltransferase [Crocinitomicaceae bacterium]